MTVARYMFLPARFAEALTGLFSILIMEVCTPHRLLGTTAPGLVYYDNAGKTHMDVADKLRALNAEREPLEEAHLRAASESSGSRSALSARSLSATSSASACAVRVRDLVNCRVSSWRRQAHRR